MDSIICQNFNDYEILIQDGNSTDDTVDIISKIQREYAKYNFTIIVEKDEGIYDAMNKGVKKAKGEWIYFLGSDDYLYDETVLTKVCRKLKENSFKYQLVYGNVISPAFGGVYGGEFDGATLLDKNICHQSIFYKKAVFDLIGLFNLRYPILADYDYNLRCFFHRKVKVKHVDLIIANFSQGGFSSQRTDEIFVADFPNPASLVKRYAYTKLALGSVKTYCATHIEFLRLLLKRLISQIS